MQAELAHANFVQLLPAVRRPPLNDSLNNPQKHLPGGGGGVKGQVSKA